MESTALQPEALVVEVLVHDAYIAITQQVQSPEDHSLHVHHDDLVTLSSSAEVLREVVEFQQHDGIVDKLPSSVRKQHILLNRLRSKF